MAVTTQIFGPTCHSQGIRGYGAANAKVVFVGIAPGFQELRTGRPMVGPSGQLLDGTLSAAGLQRESTYVTNLLCFRPTDPHNKDRDPTPEEVAGCNARLDAELRQLAPRVIVAVGALATTTLLPSHTIGQIVGQCVWHEGYNCWVIPTYHPAAVLRGMPGFIHDIWRSLEKLPYILSQESGYNTSEYVVIRGQEQAQELLDAIPTGALVSLDIETGSVAGPSGDWEDPFVRPIVCFSISWDGLVGYVFPVLYAKGLRWPGPARKLKWLFYNGQSDTGGLIANDIVTLPIDEDPMLRGYTYDERAGIHRLKTAAREYTRADFWEEPLHAERNAWIATQLTALKQALKARTGFLSPRNTADRLWYRAEQAKVKGVGYEVVDPDTLYKYNAKDAVNALRLHNYYTLRRTPDSDRLYNTLLLPGANALRDQTLHGMHVDQNKLAEIVIDWTPKLFYMEAELQRQAREAGWTDADDINLGSHVQRARLVYDILDMPLPKEGRTTNKKVMETFVGMHPFFDYWSNWMHMDHLMRQYIKPLPYLIRPQTSRVHPESRLHNTVTGRLAHADPPMDQIPKYVELVADEEVEGQQGFGGEAGALRELFDGVVQVNPITLKEDQYVIAEADYARIELYTGSFVSKDDKLLRALKSGDFHGNTARDIFGFNMQAWNQLKDKGFESRDYWRRESKYVTFGILNNRGARALALGELKTLTGGSEQRAQKFIDRWHNSYDKYAAYKTDIRERALRDGELVSHTGRHRHFRYLLPNDHHSLNQAINFPVQSLASDVCLSSLIELHTSLRQYGGFVLLSIHDCLVFELPQSYLNECLSLIEDTMTRPRFDGLPSIPVDVKVGPSWGASKTMHRAGDMWFKCIGKKECDICNA